jgi:DNA-directed RNA polymerase specialized sigma24 family protein
MPALPISDILHHLRALTTDGMSDKQLLQRFDSSGDEAALAALVQRHGKLVLCVCCRILATDPEVDDVFQATFAALAQKAATLRKSPCLAGCLHGAALSLALQRNTQGTSQREQGTILDEEIQQLPSGCCDVVLLCHRQGLDYTEASQRLGWPVDLLRRRLQRARDVLRRNMRRRGVTLSAMGLVIALADPASVAVPTVLERATVCSAANARCTPCNPPLECIASA